MQTQTTAPRTTTPISRGFEQLTDAAAILPRSDRRRVRICTSTGRVRSVSTPRAERIALHEAGAWLAARGRSIGALRGHRFAAGLRSSPGLVAAAMCCQPGDPYNDGLTTALAGVHAGCSNDWRRVLSGIEALATRHGYRRIVASTVAASDVTHLKRAGWENIGAGNVWCKLLRACH